MIYVASKTAHASMWREYRSVGAPIISTWIDEAGAGETTDFADLWTRCVMEARDALCLVLYRLPGEILKGALVEAGAALAMGRKVLFVGDADGLGSFLQHPDVAIVETLDGAIEEASSYVRMMRPEGYYCTDCRRPTPRDFCPKCGKPLA